MSSPQTVQMGYSWQLQMRCGQVLGSADVRVVQFPGFLIVRGLGTRVEWRNTIRKPGKMKCIPVCHNILLIN
jgi:hypothetical protein